MFLKLEEGRWNEKKKNKKQNIGQFLFNAREEMLIGQNFKEKRDNFGVYNGKILEGDTIDAKENYEKRAYEIYLNSMI